MYTAFKMVWRTLYSLFIRNTAFACKANFAYVYNFCSISGSCVQIIILRVSNLLRTYTTFALKATCAYEYDFAHKATYCVGIQLLLSRRLMHTRYVFCA